LFKAIRKGSNALNRDDNVRVNVKPGKGTSEPITKIQGMALVCDLRLDHSDRWAKAPGYVCCIVGAPITHNDNV